MFTFIKTKSKWECTLLSIMQQRGHMQDSGNTGVLDNEYQSIRCLATKWVLYNVIIIELNNLDYSITKKKNEEYLR